MARLESPAIVVRKMDFRETSRLLRLFTREMGAFTVLAKGAHRPRSAFLGLLDLFHLVEARISSDPRREIQILTRARLTRAHQGLGRSPARTACASYLVEAANAALPDGRPDPALFDLLASGLYLVERFPLGRLGLAVLAWETRFLDTLGQGFVLDSCPACGGPQEERNGLRAFSVAEGGALCPRHRPGTDHQWVPTGVIDLLRDFRRLPAPGLARLDPPKELVERTADLVRGGIRYRLEKELRSEKVMRSLT